MDAKEEIKNRLSIVDVVGDYAKLLPNGSAGFKCLCPFHDDHHPSMIVNDRKNFAWCFACNSGGDIFSFVQKIENCSFPEALRILAKKAEIPLEKIKMPTKKETDEKEKLFLCVEFAAEYFENNLKNSERAQNILKKREIPPEILQNFRVGFAPRSPDGLLKFLLERGFSRAEISKAGLSVPDENGGQKDKFRDRIVFPIWNFRGRMCAFGGRYIGDFEKAPKYLNSPETPIYKKSETLFAAKNIAEILREKKSAIVVEGYFDALAVFAAGHKNVVAPCGVAFTDAHARILRRSVDEIFFAFDVDPAGQIAARKAAAVALKNRLKIGIVPIPGGKDPDEARRENPEKLQSALKNPDRGIDAFLARSFHFRNPKNLADKKAICAELFPLFSAIENEIEREFYLKKLAKKIEILPEKLETEFSKSAENSPPKKTFSPPAKKISATQYFLGLLLARPELFWETAKKNFFPELLPPSDEKKIFKIFWENDGNFEKIPDEFSEMAKKWAIFAEEKIKNFSEILQKKEFETLLKNVLNRLISAKQKELSEKLTPENMAENLSKINELNKIRQKIG